MNLLKKILVIASVLMLAASTSVKAQYALLPDSLLAGRPVYQVHYIDTLMDFGRGVKLRTQMCLPVTDRPIPVIVMRNPYLPAQLTLDQMPGVRQYAERGLGYIIQHCRGTGGSEGQFQPNIDERQDGLALAHWLNDQPWISGIGLTGTSYMALTCWIIADVLPPKVKCIHLHHYGIDRHLSAYNSGLFRQDILTAWSIGNAREPIRKPKMDPAAPYYKEERYMPQLTMDEDLLGCRLPWYRDWILHTDYTDPYWQQGVWDTLRNIPPKIQVPMTIVAGHYDHHNEGTILGYQLLPESTKAKSRLIVGSWNHSFDTTPVAHHPKHDHDVNIDVDAFNWMYSLLVAHEDPKHEVLVYNIGEDKWHHLDKWPATSTDYDTLYLADLKKIGGGGLPTAAGKCTFVYDPQNPVMSVGGETLFSSVQSRGSIAQPAPGYREDVLTFMTEPTLQPISLDGKIRAVLYMSSDVDDTALTFKVSDVFPDGTAYNIRSGITTLAYRNNRLGARQLYKPGTVVELTIEALPIMWQVLPGHCLRIDISSSNFPEYAIHSNYAGVWSEQTKTRIAHQTLYLDASHPSRIELPIAGESPAQTTLDYLQQGWQTPPQSARPQVWWHWMNGNISKAGILKDLEWMKRIGLGGLHHFDASLQTPQIVPERLIYMQPGWKDAFAYATAKADSLGLEMVIASAPGWSSTGGPWVEPKDAMKKLVWRDVEVRGGHKLSMQLPTPFTATGSMQNASPAGRGEASKQTYYEDVAVIAMKLQADDWTLEGLKASMQTSGLTAEVQPDALEQLCDGDLLNGIRLDEGKDGFAWITYDMKSPVTVRSVTVSIGSNDGLTLEKSDDGRTFTAVCPLMPMSTAQSTLSVPETTARYYRLKIKTETKGIKVNEWNLYGVSRVNHAEQKAGFSATDRLTAFDTPACTGESFPAVSDVVDLTAMVDKEGHLIWKAPKGRWRIYRIGWSLTGKMNYPAPPEATGLEIDKLDPVAWRKYFTTYLNMYREASHGLLGQRGIQYVLTDSYEAEHQTWTTAMFQEFRNRRGYDLHPWLPVLTGAIIGSPAESDAFLRDWRKTIEELYKENYDLLTEIAQRDYGMKGRYAESHEGGRAMVADGMDVKATAQIPMSAMWCGARWMPKTPDGDYIRTVYQADDHESASVAHLYGQNIAAAESMTSSESDKGTGYDWCPERLKRIADLELAEGINRIVIHESTHQPADDKVPGLSLGGIGQWFNRHDTWAEQATAWVDYLSRSSFMLQQGRNQADVLVYYGEDGNITSLYAAGPPTVPQGYNFDYCNADALCHLIDCKEGYLVSSASGTRYRLLWIDANVEYMSMEVLRKIATLAKEGAIIGGQRPLHPYSLMDSQEEFSALVNEIWGPKDGSSLLTMTELLNQHGVTADCQLPEKGMRFLHRTLPDAEIYWLNRPDKKDVKRLEVAFRVSGLVPHIWHPESGLMEEASYKMTNGQTIVTMDFAPNDALFVVFCGDTEVCEHLLPEHEEKQIAVIDTPWTINFQEHRGAPVSTTFQTLVSLSENEDPGIRYFSGTATYHNTLTVKSLTVGATYLLNLGKVKNLAEVIVNGQSAGIVWKEPFRVDVTGLLREGENRIEICVTNMWVNRLIGDAQPDCKERITFTDAKYYSADSPLEESGLIGPVTLNELTKE